jgi:hypothetical protein
MSLLGLLTVKTEIKNDICLILKEMLTIMRKLDI